MATTTVDFSAFTASRTCSQVIPSANTVGRVAVGQTVAADFIQPK